MTRGPQDMGTQSFGATEIASMAREASRRGSQGSSIIFADQLQSLFMDSHETL